MQECSFNAYYVAKDFLNVQSQCDCLQTYFSTVGEPGEKKIFYLDSTAYYPFTADKLGWGFSIFCIAGLLRTKSTRTIKGLFSVAAVPQRY